MAKGLKPDSEVKEIIEKSKDGKTAIRYKVVEEVIDLDALRKEKEALEAQLAEKEPSEKELIELGKGFHPYFDYAVKAGIPERINQINEILGV